VSPTLSEMVRPKRVREAAFRILDGEAVVVLSNRAEIKVLNDVGARIWQLCDGQSSIEKILEILCEEFEAGEDVLRADLAEFLKELTDRRMIEDAPAIP